MKKLLFIAAACMLAAACTPQDGGGETASLEVSPKSLTFGAEDTTPQEITVTATGVEWEYTVPSSADWITVDDGTAGKLLVSVAKNPTAEKRTASIRITAKDNDDLEPVSVTVTQAGSETPEVYSLTVDPAALTFEAEGAAGQSVKVTASGEGMTWSATVEDAAKEWITLSATEGGEGETTLTVTVQDNPDTAERSANVTLTPSVESAGPKAIRVTQEAKVLPPSLSITLDNGAEPNEGYHYDYKGTDGQYDKITLQAVNIEWSASVSYDSETEEWITIIPYKGENVNHIEFSVAKNPAPEARTGTIIVTTETEGIGPFEIPVTQEGMPEFLSTLTEDVQLASFSHNKVIVSPNNDYRDLPYTYWDLRFWTEGISLNKFDRYVGTGEKLCIYLASTPLQTNDDAIYYLPDGTYEIGAYFDYGTEPVPWTLSGGTEYSDPTYPNGCWYQILTEDEYTDRVCLTNGTMTVTRNGENYTLTFDFTSDAGYKVTGSFEGTFDLYAQ